MSDWFDAPEDQQDAERERYENASAALLAALRAGVSHKHMRVLCFECGIEFKDVMFMLHSQTMDALR